MKEFDRVTVNADIRSNQDGMPVIRPSGSKECLMSFYDDAGAEVFREFESFIINFLPHDNFSFQESDELKVTQESEAFRKSLIIYF